MKVASLALFAILIISVLASAYQANALSPVPFTTKATVTSTNPQFQQVYESGAGVYFLDANATHIQQTRYNVTGGTVTSAAAKPVAAGTGVVTVNHSEYYNYSNSTGWVQFGSQIAIASGQMQYNNMQGGSSSNRQEQYKALAGGTLSDIAWRADFLFSYSSYTASPDAILFGMAQNTNWFGDGSSNDFIGVVFNGGAVQIYATDGTSTTTSSTITINSATNYYPTLERTSATSVTLYVYTNSGRTSQTAGSPVTLAIPSTIQSLSYIVHSNRWGAGTGNLYSGVTDDLKLTWTTSATAAANFSATSAVHSSPVDLSRHALSVDGTDDYVISTSNLGLSGNAEFTIIARVYWSDPVWTPDYPSAMGIDTTYTTNRGLAMTFSSGQPALDFWEKRFRADTALNPQTWYTVGMTKTAGLVSTTSKIFVNGAQVPGHLEGPDSNPDILNAPAVVGRLDATRLWKGYIDEVFYYNVAKTPAQMQAISNGTFDPVGLILYYDFNEGMGTVAKDGSGSNNGVLQNGATWTTTVHGNSLSREVIYSVGRNATANVNILQKANLSDLSPIGNATVTSSYSPRGISQSLSRLYVPLYEATTNGKLHLGSANRDLTGYAQVSIYNGTVSNPAYGTLMNIDAPNADVLMHSSGTTVFGEYLTANSALVGAAITNIGVYLKLAGSPTGSIAIGVFSTAGTQLFSCGSKDANTLTGGYVLYSFDCGGSYVLPAGVLIGVKYTGGNFPTNYVQAGYRGADVFDGANSVYGAYSGGFSTNSGGDAAGLYISTSNVKAAVVDGSPDKKYVFFECGTSSLCAVKHASSASTISTGLAHAAGRQYSIIPMSGKVLVQTSAAVYELNTSTDAITTLYSKTFLTRYPQTFTIGPAARSYSSAPAYVADSAEAYSHVPSTGAASQVSVMVEQANNSTGALSPYAPAKYYFLQQNDLVVEGTSASSTSWTVKDPGTRLDLSLTTYKEDLGVNLALDNTVLSQNVVRLVCGTGSYNVTLAKFAIGADNDCTYWKVRDTASDPIGRQLPYARTKELVHANPYTSYNVHISVFQVGTFSATVKYNAKDIDFNIFDSGNNASFHLLYGQCYDIVYKDVLTGETVQSQRLCADDVFFKEAILSKTLGFNFWSSPWGVYHHYNATTHILDLFVRHAPAPYDYKVKITNKNESLIVNANVTASAELDHRVYNLTSYSANKPFLLKVYTSDDKQLYKVYLDDRPLYFKPVADLFGGIEFAGWNILFFLPLIFIAGFTRNLAGIGAGLSGIFVAFINWLGIINLPDPVVWIIIVVGIIGFFAYRRMYE